MRRVLIIIASAGFLGYAPVISGTFGTLAGIPAFAALAALRPLSAVAYVTAFLVFVAGACWVAGRAEEIFGEHDCGKIVIDEVAGYLTATLWLDFTWPAVLCAFVTFRVFDVLKPYPAGWIDRNVSGGRGIVLDDVVAGLYANAATRLLLWWLT